MHWIARALARRAGTSASGGGHGPSAGTSAFALSRVALTGVLAIAGVAFLFTGIAIYEERQRVLGDSAARAARLALVLEEQALRAVQAVDLTLQNVVDVLVSSPGLSDHDPAFEKRLRTKRDQLPFVRALFVIGADGFITQDTDHPRTPRVTLADRPYFRLHHDDPSVGLHIGRPLVSRSVNRWFVSISRRIDDGAGRFAGVAVAAVEPRYFDEFYRKVGMQEADSISVFHRDGTLYWRTPHVDDKIGVSFAHLPLFQRHLPARPSHVYRTTSLHDGKPLMVGYRVVEGLPFVVTVGIDEYALLAVWRRAALGTATATVLLVALVVVVFVLVSRHARQRAAVQEQLLQAQKLEALGRMTGGIAHDFGNVLGVITVNLELLRKHAHELPVAVNAAITAAKQGTTLASQLLTFARRQRLAVEPCDANHLVSSLKPLLEQAAGSSIELSTTLSEDLWPCLTDHGQLSAALLNLVINARDAMPGGKGTIRIVTENRRPEAMAPDRDLAEGDYVCVAVVDNGRGMPADVLRRAAEPFYTTKGHGTGTGLGLSQIYGFTRQVGGRLAIDSTEGIGTSVRLFFRRAGADAPADRTAAPARALRVAG